MASVYHGWDGTGTMETNLCGDGGGWNGSSAGMGGTWEWNWMGMEMRSVGRGGDGWNFCPHAGLYCRVPSLVFFFGCFLLISQVLFGSAWWTKLTSDSLVHHAVPNNTAWWTKQTSESKNYVLRVLWVLNCLDGNIIWLLHDHLTNSILTHQMTAPSALN